MNGLSCACISSRLSHCRIEEGIGGILADGGGEGDGVGGVDGEVEGDDGVATADGVSMEDIVARCSSCLEYSVAPSERQLALADGLIFTLVVRRVDIDGEGPCRVASRHCRWRVTCLGISPVEDMSVEGVGQQVRADCRLVVLVLRLVYRHRPTLASDAVCG